MSRLKKPTSPRAAPKDDLIDSLLGDENEGASSSSQSQTNSDTSPSMNRLSAVRRSPPPPPPPRIEDDENEAVFSFESQSGASLNLATSDNEEADRTLSVVRPQDDMKTRVARVSVLDSLADSLPDESSPETSDSEADSDSEDQYGKSISKVIDEESESDAADRRARMEKSIRRRTFDLEAADSVVDADYEDQSSAPTRPIETPKVEKSPEKPSEKPPEKVKGDKLQRLEDVLKRLTPQFDKKPDRAKGPLFAPVEEVAEKPASQAAERAKAADQKAGMKSALEGVQPPPAKPPGIVAKAVMPDATPTDEIKAVELSTSQSERAPTKPVTSDDEKTIAAAQTPSPAMRHNTSESPRPVWQDAKTEVISKMTSGDNPDSDPEGEQFMPTEIRPNSPGARFREQSRQAQPGAAIFSSAEAALRQSENLRVAQKRISDLEGELERVRRENENLRSAGETLRRRMDELQSNAENAEMNTQEAKKIAEEERKVLRGQISSRDREISELKSRIDDAEGRLESNFRKIRVRERDLEHRIEIIKAESQSIAASKDRMILELKRQIDQISSELNHAKAQVQETFGQFKERQETARRAVRALRIALTVLEGEEDSGSRKAE
ncbi:MAG: hypothetical protein U1E10_05830 [Bdellovibrionales bacterium]|nr:hypothetical protein [Bdellovibrionales bacterium]